MNWIDFIIIVIMLGITVVEMKRGFGKAVFDFAALLVAIRGAYMLQGPLSDVIKLTLRPATDKAILFAALFIVIGGGLMYLGRLLYSTTLISAEFFEPLLGGICGIGMGIILSHALMRIIALGSGSDAPIVISTSALGKEFLTFDSYHRLVEFLYNFNQQE